LLPLLGAQCHHRALFSDPISRQAGCRECHNPPPDASTPSRQLQRVRSLHCRSTILATRQINMPVHMSSKSVRMFVQQCCQVAVKTTI